MKTKRKLTSLTRVRKYPDINNTSVLFKTFFESQFKYLSVNRALHLVYNGYESHFDELLEKD